MWSIYRIASLEIINIFRYQNLIISIFLSKYKVDNHFSAMFTLNKIENFRSSLKSLLEFQTRYLNLREQQLNLNFIGQLLRLIPCLFFSSFSSLWYRKMYQPPCLVAVVCCHFFPDSHVCPDKNFFQCSLRKKTLVVTTNSIENE